jgi:hypothetical protein
MTKRGVILFLATLCARSAVATTFLRPYPPPSRAEWNSMERGKWLEAVTGTQKGRVHRHLSGRLRRSLYWISLAEIGAGEYGAAARDLDALIALNRPEYGRTWPPTRRGGPFSISGRLDDAIITFKPFPISLRMNSANPRGPIGWGNACTHSDALTTRGQFLRSSWNVTRPVSNSKRPPTA